MNKTGYMIYHSAEGQKNRRFVQLFQQAGQQYGFMFQQVAWENYRTEELPDFVINRTRDAVVSAYYEEQGIPVFHRAETVRIGNDKAAAIQTLQENWRHMEASDSAAQLAGPCIPESLVIYPQDSRQENVFRQKLFDWQERTGLTGKPFVLKTVDGHGGSEVFFVERIEDLQSVPLLPAVLSGRKILCQQWVDCESRDVRVYILGGQIYEAVLRQGKGDFRSNFSLGGTVRSYRLQEEQRREVMRYVQCLGGENLAMAGVDFLLDRQGRLVFNELEEMVGSRMLYTCTNRDIVGDYVRWLAELKL